MANILTLGGQPLTEGQVADLLAQLREQEEQQRDQRKILATHTRALATHVTALVTGQTDVPASAFQSGAVGWNITGKSVPGADGKTYRVQVLIRDETTIPAKGE